MRSKQSWRRTKLGHYFQIKHGYAFKGEFFADSGPYILLTPGNFRAEGGMIFKGEKEKYYTGDFPKEFLLRSGDLLVVMTDLTQNASILGSPAFINEDNKFLHNQRLGKIIGLKKSELRASFLYYLLNSSRVRDQIKGSATGSTVKHTAPERIYSVEIDLPSPSTQQVIANILSTYDNLIENNTRRIAILEQMAQMLYQEWFVNFRFPGYEQVEMVEPELGKVLEGWTIAEIGDTVQVLGGGTPSTKVPEYWNNGDIIWFSPTDLTSSGSMFASNSAKKITSLGLKESSARLFPAYSVMMTSRATIGVIAINTKEACTNQGFIICIPNKILSAYQIYYWLVENRQKINNLASGATFKEINRATFKQIQVIIPSQNVRILFDEAVSPIWKQIANLTQKNTILRQTRDMLLPKLISGELDVSSWIEEDIEEVAQALGDSGQGYGVTERVVRKVAEVGVITPIEKDGLEQTSLWG